MNNMVFHNLKIVALGMAVFALGACAGASMQGYTGPALPAGQTALVRSGPYTDLVACDGMKVPGLSVAVLPGKHAIEMKPSDQLDIYGYDGAYFFYSRITGSVTFTAEEGRKYLAYVNIAPEPATDEEVGTGYAWTGYIEDETTHKRVARTDRLRLEVEPRGYPGGTGGAAIRR